MEALQTAKDIIPAIIHDWFAAKGWQVRDHQSAMTEAFFAGRSTLLIAPTGGGKTMAGFLASLIDLMQKPCEGLHTLYISPLKALTNDIERNLITPVAEMGLPVTVESRTGDTPSHKRARQRKKSPNILLTTPESLMLMLSYHDAAHFFNKLKLVIVDETHSIARSKRGDFLSLSLARLLTIAPSHTRFGLSATVAKPLDLAAWLGPTGEPVDVIQVPHVTLPEVKLIETEGRLPFGGFSAKYAIKDIYRELAAAKNAIVFVNTRSQAELLFQWLWDENEEALPIALYHGSLARESRRKVEAMMAKGRLRALVATSALELGIDWGDIDMVLQVGAPKGVSRLLQRIGRSNHRMNEPSRAVLVPTNRFELLECEVAMRAIAAREMDGEPLLPGSIDIVVQYIVNCACSAPVKVDALYEEVLNSFSYQSLPREIFEQLFAFAVNGGNVLEHYERYARLVPHENGGWTVASRAVSARHRQNIGVIVDAARIKVARRAGKRHMRTIGEVEESFAQQLVPGDTFFFAGEVLEYIRMYDMTLEAKTAPARAPKVPHYTGSQMPLSTFLAERVRHMLVSPEEWRDLPETVREWLDLQRRFSSLPSDGRLLIEHFPYRGVHYTVIFTFEGRKANQTLGMLVTRRMERMYLKPLGFSVTDYALSITTLSPLIAPQCDALLAPDIMMQELDEWLAESPMLKRSFRQVAAVTGITEQRSVGVRKTMKQVTFSTDLIHDVLRRYEPNHILLTSARHEAERELLDAGRLSAFLARYQHAVDFRELERPSPLAIPILVDVRRERVHGEGIETLLNEHQEQSEAETLMEEIYDALDR